ncbi:hypothetical protein GCM10009718_25820 [Isoptericola halotolerans]|uniref:Zinc-ribbon domain-containing protein n=1 Tax=Isoptericola halotolerans TaxID=300560 RepID=A0ABX2A4V6_9MICO|nr:hypothetical protein [Isoptericola halotolerans]NOV97853.1 hypothetical protein [Isoptericola halotolerans]
MRRKTTAEFIAEATALHNGRWDYGLTEYVNAKTKLTIGCPEHGAFAQTPDAHLSQGQGCPRCAGNVQLTTADFIEKSLAKHGDRWDYSRANYTRWDGEVTLGCSEHGWFTQRAGTHLSGKGCRECRTDKARTRGRTQAAEAAELFVSRVHAKRSTVYEFPHIDREYQNAHSKVTAICPEHGMWKAEANNHLQGHGCPECANDDRRARGLDVIAAAAAGFAAKAQAIHGITYGYAHVDYSRANRHVLITCYVHGDFPMTPNKHLSGQGCPLCNSVPTSKPEQALRELLRAVLDGVNSDHTIRVDVPGYIAPKNARPGIQVDAFGTIPDDDRRVAVEYDGAWFHGEWGPSGPKQVRRDVRQTHAMLDAGWLVVRVREQSGRLHLPFVDVEHPNLLQFHHEWGASLVPVVAEIAAWLADQRCQGCGYRVNALGHQRKCDYGESSWV